MSVELPPFFGYPKTPRLFNDCLITEKIDGTNALVWVSDDGLHLHAGSKNRWITPENDNQGFAAWVRDNEQELLKLGPGFHFGEFWGRKIARTYGLSERRFSLFDAARYSKKIEAGCQFPACVHLVPLLYSGPFSQDRIEEYTATLVFEGSKAAPGFMRPEGLVVTLAGGTRHKVIIEK